MLISNFTCVLGHPDFSTGIFKYTDDSADDGYVDGDERESPGSFQHFQPCWNPSLSLRE